MLVANWNPAELLFPNDFTCFQIPSFQRPYEWSVTSAHALVRDSFGRVSDATAEGNESHWIGVMLLGASPFPCDLASTQAGHNCRQVLDGQQRLLTLRIWMLALMDEYLHVMGQPDLKVGGLNRQQILKTEVHSLNYDEWQALRTNAVMNIRELPTRHDNQMIQNYLYFRFLILRGKDAIFGTDEIDIPTASGEASLISEWRGDGGSPLSPSEIQELIGAIAHLQVTILTHEGKDGPVERIFETLNSKNTPLGQYDLFRNYILMQAAETQTSRRDLYNSSMRHGEERVRNLQRLDLRQTRNNLDAFFQDLVGAKTGSNVSATEAASAFKRWWETGDGEATEFIRTQLVPSMYAWTTAITAGKNGDKVLDEILSPVDGEELHVPDSALRSIWRIENLTRRSFVPVTQSLLTLWADQKASRTTEWLLRSLKAVESYAARSILAARPQSPFRGTAIQVAGAIQTWGSDAPKRLQEFFVLRNPTDKEIRREVLKSVEQEPGRDTPPAEWPVKRDFAARVSNSAFCAIFDGIACQLEGQENVKPLMLLPSERLTRRKPLSIEHLFPRSHDQWMEDLTAWDQPVLRMQTRMHSLGNTTVLPFHVNARISNKKLSEKKKELDRDGVPKYLVSEDFRTADRWTVQEIDNRTRKLCEAALKFWAV